jgi:hypothetical protein
LTHLHRSEAAMRDDDNFDLLIDVLIDTLAEKTEKAGM